jgi:hypothetical protein
VPATGADAWFGSVGGAREAPPEPSKPPQVADLLEQVVTSGGRLVGASDVLVYLVERDTHGGQRLIVRRGAGCFARSMGCSVGKGEGLAGEVWRIGAPLAVEEDQTWPGRLGGEMADRTGSAASSPSRCIHCDDPVGGCGPGLTRSFTGLVPSP